MNLKLNHSEFTAMLQMFTAIVLVHQPCDLLEKLRKALLMQVYEKLYKTAIKPRESYSIKLTLPEAIAFYEFWQLHEFNNPASYEANLIRATNNLIHQKAIV